MALNREDLMLKFVIISALFFTTMIYGEPGDFTLGGRTTLSTFGHDTSPGLGTGGVFRIRFFDSLNSEWFADYVTSNISDLAFRRDAHIGWSVLFYPFNTKPQSFVPYFLAGHCFDYTEVAAIKTTSNKVNRWSSAIQAGIGSHYYITPDVDFSLTTQYMLHLGDDIHAEINGNTVNITRSSLSLEGHLLFTLSANYRILKLW